MLNGTNISEFSHIAGDEELVLLAIASDPKSTYFTHVFVEQNRKMF